MTEQERKRHKIYSWLMSGFRIVMALFFLYQILGAFWSEELKTETFIQIAIVGLYLIGMMLLPVGRASLYVESVLIAGLIFYFNESTFISLFVFPLAASMVGKVKKMDMIAVPIILGAMIFYAFEWSSITIAFSIGMFVFFFIKEYESIGKNELIKVLRVTLAKKDEVIQKNESEMISVEKDMEGLMSMFVRLKNLNEKFEIEELLEDLVTAPSAFFHSDYAVIYALDDKKYRMLKQTGSKRRFDVPSSVPLQSGDEPEIENDYMKIPINFEGKKWGILMIYGKREEIYARGQKIQGRFNEDDYEKMAMYVKQVMFSMKYAKTLMKMEEMANKDFLTGIANRRRFMEEFERMLHRAKRGDALAMLILDVDHFKKFNDTYGHDKGDEVLKIVAEVLEEYVREVDFVGRLGGEEFGVLIPNANDQVLEIAERLRKKISLVPFVQQITISVGVSFFGQHGETLDELNKKADEALYEAKENGRNQVKVYGE